MAALGSPCVWDEQQAGLDVIATHGDPLPKSTLDSIRATKLMLKGPLTTPVGGGFKSVNVERERDRPQGFSQAAPPLRNYGPQNWGE